MKWLTRQEAVGLEEGCAVLVRRPIKPPSYEKHFLYEMQGWFRPDHITENCWGKGTEEYLLVETPIRRKKK